MRPYEVEGTVDVTVFVSHTIMANSVEEAEASFLQNDEVYNEGLQLISQGYGTADVVVTAVGYSG